MKKTLIITSLLLSGVILCPAFAYQPKSTDYVIVPDVQEEIQIDTMYENSILADKYKFTSSGITAAGEIGNFIKIKKDGKYGLINKEGTVILPPIFQRISIVKVDGKDCFAAKADGKYKLYDQKGALVPEDKIYSVVETSEMLLARDLKPQIKLAILEALNITTNKVDYEVNEIPLVNNNVKEAKVEKNEQAKEKVQENAIKTVSDKKELLDSKNEFNVAGKKFYLCETNTGIGLLDPKGEVVLEPKFDFFAVEKLGKSDKSSVFVVSENNMFSIYDLKGQIIAKQLKDSIDIYKGNKLYNYVVEDGSGLLKCGDKVLGSFVKADDGYKFVSSSFLSIFTPNKVVDVVKFFLNY